LTVDLNSGGTLTWGGSTVNIRGTLLFGSATANNETNFVNPVNLNSSSSGNGTAVNRTIQVTAGAGGDFALMSGGLSNSYGTATLVKTGNGLLVLSGSNSYNGGTQINAGNLVFSSATSVPGSGQISIIAPGALNVTGAYSTVTGWLGSNQINVNSTGALALSGTSNETINMGAYGNLTLGAVAPSATYNGVLTPSGSTFNFGGGGGMLTVGSNLSGAANGLNIAGNVILSGTNTYGGSTTITSGIAQFSSPLALGGSGANVSIASGATLAVDYPISQTTVGRISPSSSANAFTIALAANSSNPLNLDLSTTGANLTLASLGALGTQTYSGALTPSNSTYRLGGGGGTLDVTSNLSGADGLVVGSTGPGTVVLSGTNTFSGGTTVTSGTLEVANPLALPSGGGLVLGAEAVQIFGAEQADAEGLDTLSPVVSSINGSDVTGFSDPAASSPAVLPTTSQPGASAVPEPDTLLLLLAAGGGGLLWCALRYRRRCGYILLAGATDTNPKRQRGR
jgi:autotransporter-associated beta strand protein